MELIHLSSIQFVPYLGESPPVQSCVANFISARCLYLLRRETREKLRQDVAVHDVPRRKLGGVRNHNVFIAFRPFAGVDRS